MDTQQQDRSLAVGDRVRRKANAFGAPIEFGVVLGLRGPGNMESLIRIDGDGCTDPPAGYWRRSDDYELDDLDG